jgi:heme exporter protein D
MMNIADERGWSDMYTMQPASDMYRNRILPTVIPFVLLIAAAVLQYFSYDEKVKRRLKREEKEKKENMPAPKILGD